MQIYFKGIIFGRTSDLIRFCVILKLSNPSFLTVLLGRVYWGGNKKKSCTSKKVHSYVLRSPGIMQYSNIKTAIHEPLMNVPTVGTDNLVKIMIRTFC